MESTSRHWLGRHAWRGVARCCVFHSLIHKPRTAVSLSRPYFIYFFYCYPYHARLPGTDITLGHQESKSGRSPRDYSRRQTGKDHSKETGRSFTEKTGRKI